MHELGDRDRPRLGDPPNQPLPDRLAPTPDKQADPAIVQPASSASFGLDATGASPATSLIRSVTLVADPGLATSQVDTHGQTDAMQAAMQAVMPLMTESLTMSPATPVAAIGLDL